VACCEVDAELRGDEYFPTRDVRATAERDATVDEVWIDYADGQIVPVPLPSTRVRSGDGITLVWNGRPMLTIHGLPEQQKLERA
jgi:hypothetical protein